jgi:DNA-binding MarR family transcriptional regulator
MLDSGLIRKKTDQKDRRKVFLFLTKKGINLRKIASGNVKTFNERVFQKVSEQELESFHKVMQAVNETVEELKHEKNT